MISMFFSQCLQIRITYSEIWKLKSSQDFFQPRSKILESYFEGRWLKSMG